MAKLLKLRRGTTTQHGSFTGAEGEVTIDTTKDTAVIHDGSTQGGTPLAKENMDNVSSANIAARIGANAIDGSKISDGTITNAEVNASAAIAGTKIAPYFGSQDISTTGHLDFPDDSSIKLGDSDEFVIKHTAAGVSEISSSADVTVSSNLNCSAGIDVTSGNLTLPDSSEIRLGNSSDFVIEHDGHSRIKDTGDGALLLETNGGSIQLNKDTSENMIVATVDGKVELFHNGTGKIETQASGIGVAGNIAVTGTVDGRDVAQDGGKLDELYGGSNTLKNTVNIANGVTAATQSAGNNSTKVATTAYVETAIANLVDSSPGALNTLNELAAAIGDDANFSTTITNSIASNTTLANTKLPKSGGQMTGNITFSGSQTVDGRDLSADGAKLDNIESGATADQTASEVSYLLRGQIIGASTSGTGDIYNDDWYRNNNSGEGMYNQATTQHWYSDDDDYWNVAGGGSANGIRFRDDHNGTIRGYVYANNSNEIGFLNSGGSWSLKCDNSGNVTATGNVTAYSDARLKTDVNTINDALSICGKLRGVSYKWIKDGKASIGVIAQEVEEVLPEVVLTQQVLDPTGEKEVKSVDYGKIVGVLINAINELNTKLETQESYFLAELEKHKSGGH